MCDISSAFTSDKTYGVYIHIPFCKAKCSYCAFVSTPDISLKQRYIKALLREIAECSAKGGIVDTVYIGGGTPSCLDGGELYSILCAVRKAFRVTPNAEITVEANPESCGDGFVSACKDSCVNRVSMGLQSSDDEILKTVGRIHCYADFVSAAERLASCGINNISSDIILGLPRQTQTDVKKCIETFDALCSHASVYALNVECNTPLFDSGYSPDDDSVADLYEFAVRELAKRGFSRYEVSNFARCGSYSRHNLKYWQYMPYIGFGAAAHGFDGQRVRYGNSDDIIKYIGGERPNTVELSDKDVYNEYIMLALRTERGISVCDFISRFGCGLNDMSVGEAEKLESEGLLINDGKTMRLTPDKMFVMNGIIERLML